MFAKVCQPSTHLIDSAELETAIRLSVIDVEQCLARIDQGSHGSSCVGDLDRVATRLFDKMLSGSELFGEPCNSAAREAILVLYRRAQHSTEVMMAQHSDQACTKPLEDLSGKLKGFIEFISQLPQLGTYALFRMRFRMYHQMRIEMERRSFANLEELSIPYAENR